MSVSDGHTHKPKHLIVAGIVTALVPSAVALAIHRLAPWGCDASGWLCLFPLALLGVAPVAAVGLPILRFLKQRRRHHAFPDGWLTGTAWTACAAQLLVSTFSLIWADDHMRRLFFWDVLMFPYGLAAGAIAGMIFWGALASMGKARS